MFESTKPHEETSLLERAGSALAPPSPQPTLGDSGGADIPVAVYWQYVWRYRWYIATFVFFLTAVTTLVALALPKQYRSSAILRVDPASQQASQSATGIGQQSATPESEERLLATEAQVVVSPAVVLRAINKQNLASTREFGPALNVSDVTSLTDGQMDQVIKKVTAKIGVSQPTGADLLQVSFESVNPSRAASVANDLLSALIAQDADTRLHALLGSSESMQSQLTDLRAKMEQAQTALVKYESSNDILDPDSSTNIMQARLGQVNQDFGAAQAQRIALQAEDEVAQSGDLDALIPTDTTHSLLDLYQHLLQDQRQLKQMGQVYGPNYPLYRQQAALVANDQSQLRTQEEHVANGIHGQLAIAQAKENMLREALQNQKGQMDSFNLKAIRYDALKATADSYSKLYYQLQQSIENSSVAANLNSERLRVISPARVEPTPVSPRPLRDGVVAFLISLALGVGVALAKGSLDRSVSSPEQIELWFNLPVMASLPLVATGDIGALAPAGGVEVVEAEVRGPMRPPAQRSRPPAHNAYRESILSLHSALLLARDRDLHVLALTSSLPGEGKSTTTANLAVAFASMGKRTILVDTDMRKPSVHRLFGLSNLSGLSAVLRGHVPLESAVLAFERIPGLSLLPAGGMPNSPAELLHLGFSDLLEQLRQQYDYVLLDSPPALGFADTSTVAHLAEGCLLVVHAGETDRQMIAAALRQLHAAQANILGVVLNRVSKQLGTYYNYYSYSSHYSSDGGEGDDGARALEAV